MSVSKVTSRISPRQFGLKQNGTSSHFDPDILSRFVVCVFLCPKMSPHHLGSLVFLHWKYLNIWDLSVLKIGVGHIPCMLDVGYFSPRSTYISGVLRTENPHLLRASFTRTRLTAVDVFFSWCNGFCDATVRYLIVQVPRKTTDTSWNLRINQGGKEIHCSKLDFLVPC